MPMWVGMGQGGGPPWTGGRGLPLSCSLSSLLLQASVPVFIKSVRLPSVTGGTVSLHLILHQKGVLPRSPGEPKDGGASRREPNTFVDPLCGILLSAKHQTGVGHRPSAD